MPKSLSELQRSDLGISVPDYAVAELQAGRWPFGNATNLTVAGTVSAGGAGGSFLAADGTSALPAYSFTTEPTMGLYRTSAGISRFMISASTVYTVSAALLNVNGTMQATAFQTMTTLVALGAGGAATLGLTGGTGPATTTQNTWLRVLDSAGVACWVPVWK